MKKIIALILLSFSLQSQTLIKPKQIEGAAVGSILTTTGTGVPTWTNALPSTLYPTLQQVLTAGSAITTNNSITGGGLYSLTFGTGTSKIDNFLANLKSQFYISIDNGVQYSEIFNTPTEISISVSGNGSNAANYDAHAIGQSIAGNGSNNNLIIRDNISNKGLVGDADFSANVTPYAYVQHTLVTSNFVPYVGANSFTTSNNITANALSSNGTYNYNRNYLKDWDAKVSNLQQVTASTTASVVWIGDSWTMNNTCAQPVAFYLRNTFGDAGCGYFGASTVNNGSTYGVGNQTVSITRFGTWTNVGQNSFIRAVALGSDSSKTVGDSIYYVGIATDFIVHYMNKASGGSFVVRVDGTSPTTVTTAGTLSFSTTAKTGLTDVTHTLSIKVATAGSGVLINGVEVNRSTNGVRVHNLGSSGSTSGQWILQDSLSWHTGIQGLNPNMAIIQLGVNDCNQNVVPATYLGNITRIVNRVKAAMPNCDIVLFASGDIGVASTYPMSDYITLLKNYALVNNYAFIDNYSLLGSYTKANTRGLYANTTHLNLVGGELVKQNFLNYLNNGRSMYYTNGFNTPVGEQVLLNATSTASSNVGVGFSALKATKTGKNCTGVGYASLFSNLADDVNGFGKFSLYNNTSGTMNSAFGSESMLNNLGGAYNCMFGSAGLRTNQSGSNNSALGYAALYNTLNVSNNTAVGYLAGYTNSTGAGNIFLGAQSGRYETRSNKFYINNVDRSNIGNDTTLSLLYGTMAATKANQYLKVNGSLGVQSNTTNVSGSTSGTAVYSQPFVGNFYKKVIVYCAALNGTASYTFRFPFTQTPVILTTSGLAAAKVTALTTTSMTVTGATDTGFLIIEGY